MKFRRVRLDNSFLVNFVLKMPDKSVDKPSKGEGQTASTRASASAAVKLATFAASISNVSEPGSEPTMATVAVPMDQLSAKFEKQRASLRNDFSSLIQESTKPLQTLLDTLQATVNSFQTRLSSVEASAGDNFARLVTAEADIKMLQTDNQSLLDRIDDLENRSRRANLLIVNIPEGVENGKDVVTFMSEMLKELMGPVFRVPPSLERAHRKPTFRLDRSGPPRTVLVCFLKFQEN